MRYRVLHDLQYVGEHGHGLEVLEAGAIISNLTPSELAQLSHDDRFAWFGGMPNFWGCDIKIPEKLLQRDPKHYRRKQVLSVQQRENNSAAAENRPVNRIIPFIWKGRFRYAAEGLDLELLG